MLPADDLRKIKRQVVGKKHGVRTAEKKRCGPVPPSRQKSPEITESGATPAIEAAFNWHCGGKFGGHERYGDAQKERDDQQIKQGHPRTAGGDHAFESEGASRGVGKHHEDEIKKAGLAGDGSRG